MSNFQKKGIAKALMSEMVTNFEKVGVETIYIFVNRRDWNLLQFFDSMGFTKEDILNLELKVKHVINQNRLGLINS